MLCHVIYVCMYKYLFFFKKHFCLCRGKWYVFLYTLLPERSCRHSLTINRQRQRARRKHAVHARAFTNVPAKPGLFAHAKINLPLYKKMCFTICTRLEPSCWSRMSRWNTFNCLLWICDVLTFLSQSILVYFMKMGMLSSGVGDYTRDWKNSEQKVGDRRSEGRGKGKITYVSEAWKWNGKGGVQHKYILRGNDILLTCRVWQMMPFCVCVSVCILYLCAFMHSHARQTLKGLREWVWWVLARVLLQFHHRKQRV